jgi:hypothetical protein
VRRLVSGPLTWLVGGGDGGDGVLGWMRSARKPTPPPEEKPSVLPPPEAGVPRLLQRLGRRLTGPRAGGAAPAAAPAAAGGGARTLLGESAVGGVDARDVRATVLYLAEAVCPWDYDRKEPALTFVNVWNDVDAVRGDRDSASVKLVSTINPVRRSWKLTARTRLLSLGGVAGGGGAGGGPGGVVFGKAGIYLVGDTDPFVGVEADRVVSIPRLPRTSLFFNVNYRSSRKLETSPVLASVGVQQTFNLGDGLALTLRAGANSRSGWSRPFFSPVPYGRYF